MISARFDDLTPGGRSFRLSDPSAVFVATTTDAVVSVIREAEAAARRGGWVAGFVSYEAAGAFDDCLPTTSWPPEHPLAALPLAWFAAFDTCRDIARPHSAEPNPTRWNLDRDQSWHRHAVNTIRDGIAAGSFYQVNLTARLTSTVDAAEQLYADLSAAQRSSYNSLISTGDHTVVSCSPELFFSLDGDDLTARPMKGTLGRGRWPAEDHEHARRLRMSAKDQAENAMIVDLVRNDLARVAEIGTVAVTELFALEKYPTLWQLTSSVHATARSSTGLAEIFAALFPAGSITGAPKRAAMAAIADLEGRPRGIYCGAIGYLAPNSAPRAQFSVAIRTVTRADATGYAEYGAGGGITWSSEPDLEWAELLDKSKILDGPTHPDALLETMRFDARDGVANLARHLTRLTESANYFDFAFDADLITKTLLAQLGGALTASRVRLRLSRDGVVDVTVDDLPPAGPVTLALAAEPVRSDDVALFHKVADRQRYELARSSRPDVDDVVLWNERGEVTETTIANLAVRLDGQWCTPPLHCGLLPGVVRARLLDEGILQERVITIPELLAAGGVAVVSSLRQWRTASWSVNPG
jgi:para-aminobenzoate synthetase/4-amino-4-deoxychorismate lyase